MSPEPTRQPARQPGPQEVLASGLLDRDWVGAQLGTAFAIDADAADRYLDDDTDCSPHPLFEDSWCKRSLVEYLADPQARATASPHPLVDVARIVAEHPEPQAGIPTARWPGGCRRPARTPPSRCRTACPRSPGGGCAAPPSRRPSGGRRAARRGSPSAVPEPHPRPRPDPPSLPPARPEPLVTVVLVVRDDGPPAARGGRRRAGPDLRRLGARRRRRRFGRRHRRGAGRRGGVRAAASCR